MALFTWNASIMPLSVSELAARVSQFPVSQLSRHLSTSLGNWDWQPRKHETQKTFFSHSHSRESNKMKPHNGRSVSVFLFVLISPFVSRISFHLYFLVHWTLHVNVKRTKTMLVELYWFPKPTFPCHAVFCTRSIFIVPILNSREWEWEWPY
jgi:hypothetical protein